MAALALTIRILGGLGGLFWLGLFVASFIFGTTWSHWTYLWYALATGIGSAVVSGLLLKASGADEA